MAYSVVPTVAPGDSWSSSQHNTYIRDNFAALWPFTTQGDLAYASAANTLARLGIGGANAILKSNGSVPSWLAGGAARSVLKISAGGVLGFGYPEIFYASVYSSVDQTIPLSSALEVLWNAEYIDDQSWHSTSTNTSRITPGAGDFIAKAMLSPSISGGEDNQYDIYIKKNGSTNLQYIRLLAFAGYVGPIFIETPIITLVGGDYLTVHIAHSKTGTRTLYAANSFFTVQRLG
jgi:hypothetical protein